MPRDGVAEVRPFGAMEKNIVKAFTDAPRETTHQNLLYQHRGGSRAGRSVRRERGGLVSAMPSGPCVIAEETIAEIVATVPPELRHFC